MGIKIFFDNKNIFITGHTGFKGCWLSIWLNELSANITGFSLEPPTNPSLFELVKLNSRINSLIGDIRDFDLLNQALKSSDPEIIFHLAAQPLVLQSYKEPIDTFSTNIMGTVNLLEAAKNLNNLRAIVIITSDKCYKNDQLNNAFIETDPMGGYDPYSASKGCAELIVSSYRNSYFNSKDKPLIASARAGNVIGGGDWAKDRLIPDLVDGFINNRPVEIRNLHSTRPWQHVLEPISGYLTLSQKLIENGKEFAQAWNFGPSQNNEETVKLIADKTVGLWGDNASWIDQSDHSSLYEANYLRLNSEKAFKMMGWESRWDLDVTLDRTISWYKEFHKNKNADIYELCLNDISLYNKS